MKKLIWIGLSICMFSITSFAGAETLYMPGNVGITDMTAFGTNTCSQANVPQAKMVVDASGCVIGYPINLPAGKTIDNVEVAYIWELPAAPTPFNFTAYLAQNRIKPALGAIAVAGNAVTINNNSFGQPGFLNMPSLSVPVVNGSTYWVQVFSSFVDVNYVAVTYH